MKTLAPIALFVYNRPQLTEQTLQALSKNELANESLLYVFADGPKNKATQDELEKIAEVERVVKSKPWAKEIIFIKSSINKGLAQSVVAGITQIVTQHGRVIVLEDDILTSPYFLAFLNDGLEVYKNQSNVYAINSYMFPVETKEITTFLSPIATTSWGWATWADRWGCFQLEPSDKKLIQENTVISTRFNLGRHCHSYMLDNLNSWAIRWYYSVFARNGLGLFPSKSLSLNIGFGESATHTKKEFMQMELYNHPIPVALQSEINFKYLDLIIHYFEIRHQTDHMKSSKSSGGKRSGLKLIIKKICIRIQSSMWHNC